MTEPRTFEQAQKEGLIPPSIQRVLAFTGRGTITYACTDCGCFVNWPVVHAEQCPAKAEERAQEKLIRDYSTVYPELAQKVEERTPRPPNGSY